MWKPVCGAGESQAVTRDPRARARPARLAHRQVRPGDHACPGRHGSRGPGGSSGATARNRARHAATPSARAPSASQSRQREVERGDDGGRDDRGVQLPGVVVGQALAQVPGEQPAQGVGSGPSGSRSAVAGRPAGASRPHRPGRTPGPLAGAQRDGRERLGGVRGDEDPVGAGERGRVVEGGAGPRPARRACGPVTSAGSRRGSDAQPRRTVTFSAAARRSSAAGSALRHCTSDAPAASTASKPVGHAVERAPLQRGQHPVARRRSPAATPGPARRRAPRPPCRRPAPGAASGTSAHGTNSSPCSRTSGAKSTTPAGSPPTPRPNASSESATTPPAGLGGQRQVDPAGVAEHPLRGRRVGDHLGAAPPRRQQDGRRLPVRRQQHGQRRARLDVALVAEQVRGLRRPVRGRGRPTARPARRWRRRSRSAAGGRRSGRRGRGRAGRRSASRAFSRRRRAGSSRDRISRRTVRPPP